MTTLALRNTFLEVRESQGDDTCGRRSHSAPHCGRGEVAALNAVVRDQIARLNILLAETIRSGPVEAEVPGQVAPLRVRCSRPEEALEEDPAAKAAAASTADPTSSRSSNRGRRLENASSPAGCRFGGSRGDSVSQHRTGPKGRPCKGKRDRVKKALAMVEARIEQNPEVFTVGDFFLPPLVERDPKSRARVLAQWSQVAARSGRSSTQGALWQ